MKTMVIRLSSVGDIVLSGGITGALDPVIFVTKPAYRSLAKSLPGVKKVLCPPDDKLPKSVDQIVDLHGNWRSRKICHDVKGPVSRIQRHDLKRRFRVWFKQGLAPPSVIARYAEAAAVSTPTLSWGKSKKGTNDTLALIPFCRHGTKEWPLMKYAEIGRQYEGPVIIFGSEDEKDRMKPLRRAIGSKARLIADKGFDSVIDAMGKINRVVGGSRVGRDGVDRAVVCSRGTFCSRRRWTK